ncbi:histidine phosphatase family protein [Methylopila turkensis]|uniref:Phosphoglycerate mutase n=1 Tax=Methylopila turkensis TaxID=1437816 RepID=A0A9W6JQP0_9HYPH|nr:histidine phosphatase family protein [Methylopila turkensis]GLK79838.1 phosphoglycerate mutase [Methylopila turkensis]
MTPDVVFVRHGETDWNASGRLQGQTDIPLNARGRDQADAVGRALGPALPDAAGRVFVASPLSRATETMRRMRAAMGLDADGFTTDARLKELSFGRWEGSTLAEARLRDPKAMRARDADRWSFRPEEGESYADLEARVGEAVAALPGPAVIVAHGGVARVLLATLGGVARDKVSDIAIRQGRALVFGTGGWRWI